MADGFDFVVNPAAMRDLLEGPNSEVGKTITRAVVQIEAGAKRYAPVDTGRLRSSIAHDVFVDGDTVVGVVGTNVDYAPHQEFGTFKMAAHPFLRPALNDVIRRGIS